MKKHYQWELPVNSLDSLEQPGQLDAWLLDCCNCKFNSVATEAAGMELEATDMRVP